MTDAKQLFDWGKAVRDGNVTERQIAASNLIMVLSEVIRSNAELKRDLLDLQQMVCEMRGVMNARAGYVPRETLND